jgi:transposase-like protein
MTTNTSIASSVVCKLCGSTDTVKFGRYRGIPRRWCKTCHHKYADNEAIPYMRTPSNQVASAIEMYFNGRPLKVIPTLIFREYGAYITYTSVFNWISKFSLEAKSSTEQARISVGDTWLVDDTEIRVRAQFETSRLIDIIDLDTHFLLATCITSSKGPKAVRELLETAKQRAGKFPVLLASTGNSHEFTPVAQTPSINNFQKYWKRISYNRMCLIRSLKKPKTARLILDGWQAQYNYFTHQETLQGMTPAAAAQTDFAPQSWIDMAYRIK